MLCCSALYYGFNKSIEVGLLASGFKKESRLTRSLFGRVSKGQRTHRYTINEVSLRGFSLIHGVALNWSRCPALLFCILLLELLSYTT